MIDAQFEAFVRRYQDMVFGTAVRLLGNAADAEDVAQTVFLRAFQRFAEIQSSPAAAGWLKAVTRNACLNHLSRYRARLRFFSELDTHGGAAGEAFEASLTSEVASWAPENDRDRQEQLEAALRRLPDHQRVPLVLFHFEEMSYQEIATALGITLAKTKTDIHRGRDALRKLLAGDHAAR
jgi:RNA polymerase sigma-70 factor, ECF subfamily